MEEMLFKTSDMELMEKASKMLKYESYIQTRENYQFRNPRRYVNADTHRKIMGEAIRIAKSVIDKGGTDEEITQACLYLYICMDSRKYRLDWGKARKDCGIDDLIHKYMTSDISVEQ